MTESSGRKKIAWVVLCLGLLIWGITDVRKRAHFDPVLAAENPALISKHRTDLTVFTEAGAAFFDGRDPYEVSNPRGWMYLYPPLFAILMAPLHVLPPQWQGVIWYFLSLVMAWGCFRETVRLLRHAGVAEFTRGDRKTFRWIQVCIVAVILFPTLDCLQRGQVGILILYLLLLGLRLVLEGDSCRKSVAGGMVLSLSIVFKVIPALPVFFLLFLFAVHHIQKADNDNKSFRFLGAGAGVFAGLFLFFFVVPSIFIGWQANAMHLKNWSRVIGTQAMEARIEGHFSNPHSPRNQSLSNALYFTGTQLVSWVPDSREPNPWRYTEPKGRFMTSSVATNTVLAIRVLLCLMLIPLAWKRSGDALGRLAAFGLACVAMLIASPVARGHYFMLELLAVLFVSLWVWKYRGPQKALVCAGIPAILCLMHYVFISSPQVQGLFNSGILFFGTLGIGTALWFTVMTCQLVTFSPEEKAANVDFEPSE